ncbi:MAG TPA: hypothetical protein VGG41_10795 [Solirubrobacteraceae bacterium]|jgi:hypothetical protein
MPTPLSITHANRTTSVGVEFAHQSPSTQEEAFIQRVRRHGEHVEIAVLLADGSDATARLGRADWEWLELRAGDIAPVRLLSA